MFVSVQHQDLYFCNRQLEHIVHLTLHNQNRAMLFRPAVVKMVYASHLYVYVKLFLKITSEIGCLGFV